MTDFTVDAGSPFALALAAAREAGERRDVERLDEHYRRAVRLARNESMSLATAVAVEHVSGLRALQQSTRALARCAEYLAGDAESLRLRLLRAETDLTRGDFSRIDADLDTIRRITGGRPMPPADEALCNRLEGLAASRQDRFSHALQCLSQARAGYASVGDNQAVTVIDDDIRAVTVRQGGATADRPEDAAEGTPTARLARSEELRMAGRYEEALRELDPALQGSLDPAIRFFFLEAQVRLLRLLRADDEAGALMPQLYEAAKMSAQPAANRLAADRLATVEPSVLASPDHPLQQVRRLVQGKQLDQAERLLLAHNATAEPDDRHAAEWHLAAGELSMAISGGDPAIISQAAGHFMESARHAAAGSLVAIRITALRSLGHAHVALGEMGSAVAAWAQAHRLEESVAALQPTYQVRIRMLYPVPDEFDEQIRVAARASEREPLARASVVVAMEAARGAAILPHISPDGRQLVRELPTPGDHTDARRWIRQAVRELPRSQAIWMLHATPEEVHHAFIWRQTLRHRSVPCAREKLIEAINKLAACWRAGGDNLELDLMRAPGAPAMFDQRLSTIAELLGLPALPELPKHVTRIAVVAGGELAEIPFALLPCPGADDTLIGRRYALSDLPCLSVRNPLHQRAGTQRGTRMLLLQPDLTLTAAAEVSGRKVLAGEHATAEALRDELAHGQYAQVRIDTHGQFTSEVSQTPVIRLAPPGSVGELSPGELQSMNLSTTGTLILGACESGMATRNERDERDGFVSAALLSGASAVLAARWEALDDVAARVLDRFEENLRHYPRDVALFFAQRVEDTRDRSGDPRSKWPATAAHPARWAPWVLFGDVGHQSPSGPAWRSSVRAIRRARHLGGSDE